MRKYTFYLFVIVGIWACSKDAEEPTNPLVDPIVDPIVEPIEEVYFPPLEHSEWDSINVDSLGWNMNKLDELNAYLETNKSKGFIILKEGKIAVEEYYNNHSADENWTWYSCAKSLTSVLVGMAQYDGYLNIDEPTSTYLGSNWTSLSQEQEDQVLVKNHITMTTGFESNINNLLLWTCTLPNCFNFANEPGTFWEYHQGAFTLTQDIISGAYGASFKEYCKDNLLDKIGMSGMWEELLDLRFFSSTTRSMARFGWLVANKGKWDEDVVFPESYYEEMILTSQEDNLSYGYLWWLNGKTSFKTPGDDTVYNGSLIPNAPDDMFCALGAQDQKIYIVPSQDLVIVRCGDDPSGSNLANSSFDNDLWEKINDVIQ